jgi:hypothetical protein
MMNRTALAALAVVAGSGCTREAPEPAAASAVETVPLHVLARTIGIYRGRTVRTCGETMVPVTDAQGVVSQWHLSAPDTTRERATAFVAVATCHGERPHLVDGCVTGRVARNDGSLEDPQSMHLVSHLVGSWEWWMHPHCLSRGP